MLPSVLFPVNMRIGLIPCGISIKKAVEGSHRIMNDNFVQGVLKKKILEPNCTDKGIRDL